MKALLKNYRQSPRKVRLVANVIKGKSISAAETELMFLVKRASDPILKLLKSAIANAKQNNSVNPENLYVLDVRVDKGIVLKRFRPRARGSASRINKRTSHVILTLAERGEKVVKKKKSEKPVVAKAKPAPKKRVAKAKKEEKA
jgi:large subunit ribosomal protein L22